MKRKNYYLLMAAAVLGLSLSVTSCVDNIDNNGGNSSSEQQEEVVQSKADKYWSVVSQLVSTDDYTPDYEGKTFEPVYGVAQEGDPTTRLVYTNDVATAAERFSDIVEKEGIDENTQTYTFDDPDIGTLTYTKGDEDGAILATVDVNIKQIPSLKKILYVPGGLSNGHFEGKAYYRFGDVVSRQTTDYDGNAATEYWVCVRPAFGPEGKEESHWVCLNVLPKKNVYHYKGSNGIDYYLPTGLGTNMEHMQNLVELMWAICYPAKWYQNVTQHAKDGLKMFHDFSADNIKYHNQHFWQNVQDGWEEYNIFKKVFGMYRERLASELKAEQFGLIYNGYSWYKTISWNCTLWTANYSTGQTSDYKYRNLHKATYDKVTCNMRDTHFDCRKLGPNSDNYSEFLGDRQKYWAVRHATGKELCANGRYDVKQPLNGCTTEYRYYEDVIPLNDLSEDPEVTQDANNNSENWNLDAFGGSSAYHYGDIYKDESGSKWIVIHPSGQHTEESPFTELVCFEGLRKVDDETTVSKLPSRDEAIRGAFWLEMLYNQTTKYKSVKSLDNWTINKVPYGYTVMGLVDPVYFEPRDYFQMITAQNGDIRQSTLAASIAYRSDDAEDRVRLLRWIRNNQNDSQDLHYYLWEHYVTTPDSTTQFYNASAYGSEPIYLEHIASQEYVDKYAPDTYAKQGLAAGDNMFNSPSTATRSIRKEADEKALWTGNYIYSMYNWRYRKFATDMWNAPVLMFRYARVYDRGKGDYANMTTSGHTLRKWLCNPWADSLDEPKEMIDYTKQSFKTSMAVQFAVLYGNDSFFLDGKAFSIPKPDKLK
jgi:hypothetical protein